MASTSLSKNYLLGTTLSDIDNPVVTRTLSVLMTKTFHQLHKALQLAYGFGDLRSYKFEFLKRPSSDGGGSPLLLLTVTELPFRSKTAYISQSMKSKCITLQQVLDNPRYRDAIIEYHYGVDLLEGDPHIIGRSMERHRRVDDCWKITIDIIGREEGSTLIRCVVGSGHSVLEGCEGPLGWQNFKSMCKIVSQAEDREAAIRKLSDLDRTMMEEFEHVNEGPLNPDEYNMGYVNFLLATLNLEES